MNRRNVPKPKRIFVQEPTPPQALGVFHIVERSAIRSGGVFGIDGGGLASLDNHLDRVHLPARVGLQMQSAIESRMLLDESKAERLLGR